MQKNNVDTAALGYFFLCWGARKYIKLQLVEILVIRKRNGTAWKPSILGPPLRTQTLHKGTPNTSLRLAYNLDTAYGARGRKHNWNSGGARKGTGDTKTGPPVRIQNIHFGIASAHTYLSPRNPEYRHPWPLLTNSQLAMVPEWKLFFAS